MVHKKLGLILILREMFAQQHKFAFVFAVCVLSCSERRPADLSNQDDTIVLSCPVLSCSHVHHDHHDHHDRGDYEEVGSYMTKLKVVHKEVGGCLISYNLQLACVKMLEVIWPDAHCHVNRLNWQSLVTQSVSQSVRYVGIELLRQLKIVCGQKMSKIQPFTYNFFTL